MSGHHVNLAQLPESAKSSSVLSRADNSGDDFILYLLAGSVPATPHPCTQAAVHVLGQDHCYATHCGWHGKSLLFQTWLVTMLKVVFR